MDYKMLWNFFDQYGFMLTMLALSGIVVLGFLKWVGVFKKVKDSHKKYVYYALSCLFSIIACTIYILVTKSFAWASYGILCGAVIGLTGAVYTVYENTGFRKLWKKAILDNISKFFKMITSAIVSGTLTKDKIKKLAIDLGSQTLAELSAEAKTIEETKNNNVAENVQQ